MKTLMKAFLLFCCSVPALAASGPARAGDVSRHALGDWTVYCFHEGDRAGREEIITLTDRAEALKATPGWNRSGMNFFALDAGADKLLIDAGNSGANTRDMLAQAGIAAEAVTDILLTHMHRDHIGGLLDEGGKAVFPKATLHVAKEEADYWRGRAEAADRVFADPGVYLSYDVDAQTALATRRALMAQLAESGEAVAGAHIPSPGIGRIAKGDKAGEDYRFTPLPPQ